MNDQSIKGITPPEAWEIMQSDSQAIVLDVRTSMEFDYVGHPAGAVNIPWQEAPEWKIDDNFVQKVRDKLRHIYETTDSIEDITILTICRSGKRSQLAAQALTEGGFNKVYNIEQGFEGDRDGAKHRSRINGWRFHNLPWEQS